MSSSPPSMGMSNNFNTHMKKENLPRLAKVSCSLLTNLMRSASMLSACFGDAGRRKYGGNSARGCCQLNDRSLECRFPSRNNAFTRLNTRQTYNRITGADIAAQPGSYSSATVFVLRCVLDLQVLASGAYNSLYLDKKTKHISHVQNAIEHTLPASNSLPSNFL